MSDPKIASATTLLAGEEPHGNLKARHNMERYAGISTGPSFFDGPFLGFPYSEIDNAEASILIEEPAMDQPGFLDGFDLFPVEYPTNYLELRLQQLTDDMRRYCNHHYSQTSQSTIFPEAISASLLSAENLLKLVNLYFYRWHHQWPILHWPTFDVDAASLPLLLAVALSGAAYSRDEDAVSEDPISAKIFYEIAEGYIYNRLEIATLQTSTTGHMLPDEVVETCQAALLTEVLQKGVNDTRIRQRVFAKRHPALVATLRSLGILGITHQASTSTTSWDTFVKVELLVRLATWTFMSDTLPMLFCNQPPSLVLSEMTGDLPCDGALWDAETEHDFDEALRQLPPMPERQLCIQKLVADLLDDESETGHPAYKRDLNPEHQYILIVALQPICFTLRATIRTESCVVAATRALQRWWRGWNRLPQNAKLGLVRHAPELASMTLKTLEAGKSKDAMASFRYLSGLPSDDTVHFFDFMKSNSVGTKA